MWTSTDLFRSSVLWSTASSCRNRGSNRGRRPPRVAIAGSTPWLYLEGAASSCHCRGTNRGSADWVGLPNPHSCRHCGTKPGFDFLLASLTWFKPGERLSLANGWMCQYPYGKNTGVRTMVQTGGKVTCRNSRTARNDSDELGLDPVVIHVSQPLLVSLSWCQPLLVSLSWFNPVV